MLLNLGILSILNPADDNDVLIVLEAGQFSGDLDLLTGRSPIVTAVARGRLRILQVLSEKLPELLIKAPLLSDKPYYCFSSSSRAA